MSENVSGLSEQELDAIFGSDEASATSPDAQPPETSVADGSISFEATVAAAVVPAVPATPPTASRSLFAAWAAEIAATDPTPAAVASDSESSGLNDILAVAATLNREGLTRPVPAEPLELHGGETPSLGLLIHDDEVDDHLEGSIGRFGEAGGATLVAHDHVELGGVSAAALEGGLVEEANVALGRASEASVKEERREAKRRPWIAAAVILIAVGVGVGLVMTQGPEAPTTPVAAGPAGGAAAGRAGEASVSARPRDLERGRGDAMKAPSATPLDRPADPVLLAGADAGTDAGDGERGGGIAGEAPPGEDGRDDASAGRSRSTARDDRSGAAPNAPTKGGDPAEGADSPADDPAATPLAADADPPAADSPPAAPDPAPPADAPAADKGPMSASEQDKVDCLLDASLEKCGGKKPAAADQGEGGEDGPTLPEKLATAQLRDGFATVKAAAKACGQEHGAAAGVKVKVHVSIEGATGKVKSAAAKGEHAGTPLGDCVAAAVLEATFPRFAKDVMGTDYSLAM